MEKEINFSIIIPLYNKANYVTQTLKCVVSQTFIDFEVIIVNDGSTDNSVDIVKQFNDSRIKLFSKKNEGVSAARNFGIEKAKFDYIAFLDADDLWLPNYLETICKLIQWYPDAGVFATAYHSNMNLKGNNTELIKQTCSIENTALVVDYCKELMKEKIFPLWTGAVCVHRKFFIEAGLFPIGIKRGEDLDMWLRLSLKTSIAVVNFPLAVYNQITENNATRKYESYKESFPYWKWYYYGKSRYLAKYATRKIISLIIVALHNKAYNDVFVLLFKVKGLHALRSRLFLLIKTVLQLTKLLKI